MKRFSFSLWKTGSTTRLSFFRSLRGKLILLFLAISLIPLITMGLLAYIQAQEVLKAEVINKLIAVRDIKAKRVVNYFNERFSNVKVLSQNPATMTAIHAFDEAIHADMKVSGTDEVETMKQYRKLYSEQPELVNADDSSAYSTIHAQYHPMFHAYKNTYDYYDIFLVEPHNGNMVYTVEKEEDFGTSLKNGPYANTNLSHVFQRAMTASYGDFTKLADFAYYEASHESFSFIASPIFEDSQVKGVLIFQLLTIQLDAIMQEHNGLGETGETLLVSSDDFLLRSNSRFFPESTLFKQKMDNVATRASAAGETGVTEVIDKQGKIDIVAYTPLNISGVRWALIVKVNKTEAFAPVQQILLGILGIMVIGAITIVGVIFWISHSITQPIQQMTEVADQLAEGHLNLTVEFQRKDEIGVMSNAARQMIINLQHLIEDIVQVSQGLAVGNLRVTPQAQYQGDFVQIKTALETALCNQRQVVEDIVQVSHDFMAGELNVTFHAEYQGDFIQIKTALETALSNQKQVIQDIVQLSQSLAEGKVSVSPQAEYWGDFVQIKNALEMALANLRQVIKNIVQVSQELAEGKASSMSETEYRGDFAQIKEALEIATLKLVNVTQQNAAQDWLKTGQNQLNDQMSGEQNIVELSHNIVSFLTLYLDAQVGVCYLLEETAEQQSHPLKLLASYAHTRRKNLADEFQFTQGLVERAAKEQKSILLTITSDLGETIPRYLIVVPFLHENRVKGIILLGSLAELTNIQQDFLHQVMPNIGVAMNATEARTQMQELLQKTQFQSQELQQQQEELQHTNEELQSQSEELQNQTEELQNQAEELRQTNEELEERTGELERQKAEIRDKNLVLEETQKAIETKAQELELASKYKSEFLANMSHELRTPLNSLLILAQLLAENKTGNLTDKQMEYAKTIRSAGSDLLTLINDILDLSKVEAGKMEVHIDYVSLPEMVENFEQKFRPLAEEKNLAFHLMVADEVPAILYTDAQRLKQILNNLLSNAFKFTHQGNIKLDIRTADLQEMKTTSFLKTEYLKGVNLLAISVADTGIGIPKEKQKVIFEAFQQVDGTTSRRYGGTGLGLSISRQLAILLGGELQLQSEEGLGSTFTLYLPDSLSHSSPGVESLGSTSSGMEPVGSASPESVSPEIEPLSETSSEEVKSSGEMSLPQENIADDRANLTAGEKSILIIEDDRKFSSLLMELAQEKAFKCLLAEDGKTGLQLAEQYQPNAIMLDISLPEIDGWKVMERLKDNPKTRHIPVHFMSAFAQEMTAKKMGAIGYLLKPINIEQLGEAFQKIERFLNNTVKHLLVLVDNSVHQQKILDLVGEENIQTTIAMTVTDTLEHLGTTTFDCIILDMDIEQKTGGIKLLGQMHTQAHLYQIPLIIYAERELTSAEKALLLKCQDNITVKTVKSPEHLLDEATLFLHQVETNLSQDKRQMLHKIHDKTTTLKNKKVLIVDDDMRNVFALATILEDKEMEVVVAKDGKKALLSLEEHQDIAIVLMDIMMPEMDGYEAMQEIRKQPRHQRLPIIALTAKAMKSDKTKCLEAGANDYISKPVDTDKLISLMRVWLYR